VEEAHGVVGKVRSLHDSRPRLASRLAVTCSRRCSCSSRAGFVNRIGDDGHPFGEGGLLGAAGREVSGRMMRSLGAGIRGRYLPASSGSLGPGGVEQATILRAARMMTETCRSGQLPLFRWSTRLLCWFLTGRVDVGSPP
jgi:hypothetical protein